MVYIKNEITYCDWYVHTWISTVPMFVDVSYSDFVSLIILQNLFSDDISESEHERQIFFHNGFFGVGFVTAVSNLVLCEMSIFCGSRPCIFVWSVDLTRCPLIFVSITRWATARDEYSSPSDGISGTMLLHSTNSENDTDTSPASDLKFPDSSIFPVKTSLSHHNLYVLIVSIMVHCCFPSMLTVTLARTWLKWCNVYSNVFKCIQMM